MVLGVILFQTQWPYGYVTLLPINEQVFLHLGFCSAHFKYRIRPVGQALSK
jgi:hypothetical protein